MTPGSLLDLLPRPRTPEYDVLPQWLRDEVDVIRKGYRPMKPGEMDDLATLPKKLENLALEQRMLTATIKDVHKAQSALGGKLLPLIEAIHKTLAEHQTKLLEHDKRLDSHDVQLGVHAKKHVEHAESITGVHQRLVVVEQLVTTTVTKRKPHKRK